MDAGQFEWPNVVSILFGYFDHVVQHAALTLQMIISYLVACNDHMRRTTDVTRAQTSFKWLLGNKQLSRPLSNGVTDQLESFNDFPYLGNNNWHTNKVKSTRL